MGETENWWLRGWNPAKRWQLREMTKATSEYILNHSNIKLKGDINGEAANIMEQLWAEIRGLA